MNVLEKEVLGEDVGGKCLVKSRGQEEAGLWILRSGVLVAWGVERSEVQVPAQ